MYIAGYTFHLLISFNTKQIPKGCVLFSQRTISDKQLDQQRRKEIKLKSQADVQRLKSSTVPAYLLRN
jgi:hypothetical protein